MWGVVMLLYSWSAAELWSNRLIIFVIEVEIVFFALVLEILKKGFNREDFVAVLSFHCSRNRQ